MRALAAALCVVVFACKPSSRVAEAASEPGTQDLGPQDAGGSCLDRELQRRGLNQFGDPPDTAYAGGTPLFEEASGKTRTRTDYVRSRHPDVAKACPTD